MQDKKARAAFQKQVSSFEHDFVEPLEQASNHEVLEAARQREATSMSW